ncbi:MAG: hypothetical protein R3B54_07475 [Bdellovibrionota bacterium]
MVVSVSVARDLQPQERHRANGGGNTAEFDESATQFDQALNLVEEKFQRAVELLPNESPADLAVAIFAEPEVINLLGPSALDRLPSIVHRWQQRMGDPAKRRKKTAQSPQELADRIVKLLIDWLRPPSNKSRSNKALQEYLEKKLKEDAKKKADEDFQRFKERRDFYEKRAEELKKELDQYKGSFQKEFEEQLTPEVREKLRQMEEQSEASSGD